MEGVEDINKNGNKLESEWLGTNRKLAPCGVVYHPEEKTVPHGDSYDPEPMKTRCDGGEAT